MRMLMRAVDDSRRDARTRNVVAKHNGHLRRKFRIDVSERLGRFLSLKVRARGCQGEPDSIDKLQSNRVVRHAQRNGVVRAAEGLGHIVARFHHERERPRPKLRNHIVRELRHVTAIASKRRRRANKPRNSFVGVATFIGENSLGGTCETDGNADAIYRIGWENDGLARGKRRDSLAQLGVIDHSCLFQTRRLHRRHFLSAGLYQPRALEWERVRKRHRDATRAKRARSLHGPNQAQKSMGHRTRIPIARGFPSRTDSRRTRIG